MYSSIILRKETKADVLDTFVFCFRSKDGRIGYVRLFASNAFRMMRTGFRKKGGEILKKTTLDRSPNIIITERK